ncbi:hypothetical protein DFH06DRAFT_1185329 [Mycena polygramma]|nr:hypothetical protein DFH06DRAFT_1185329 [Mycena polygramma]
MSASEAPVLLGRICSAWRDISLSTPRLWASLHVTEPALYSDYIENALVEQKVAQRVEITKTWLGRSGQYPLSLSLQCTLEYVHRPDSALNTRRFIEALVPFASRWQHVDFTIPLSIVLTIMSHLEADTPLLETIAFHPQFNHSLAQPGEWGPFGILRGPRIRSLSIPGRIFILGQLPLQWNQLTTLSIGESSWGADGLTSEAILHTLSYCPELRRCKLLVNDLNPGSMVLNPTFDHPVVELPFLRILKLHYDTVVAPAASFLFTRLSLPELHSFTLRGPANGQTADELNPALIDFFARSDCLEILDLDCSLLSKSALLECLRGFPPTIKQLKLCTIPTGWGPVLSLDDDALVALTPNPDIGAVACPALQHLSIQNISHITEAAILQFITARMMQSRTLTRVDCQFERPVALDLVPSLKPFLETGLEVSLRYPDASFLQFSPWYGLPDAPQPPGWGAWGALPQAPPPDQW